MLVLFVILVHKFCTDNISDPKPPGGIQTVVTVPVTVGIVFTGKKIADKRSKSIAFSVAAGFSVGNLRDLRSPEDMKKIPDIRIIRSPLNE